MKSNEEQKLSLRNESRILEVKKFLTNFVNSIISHPYKALAVVFIFWFLEGHFSFEASFFITLFFLFLLLIWDSRILIAFALLFLLSCPFYLLIDDKLRAEQMAVYAYYLLFLGITLMLFEQIKWSKIFKKKGKRKKKIHDIKKDMPLDPTKG